MESDIITSYLIIPNRQEEINVRSINKNLKSLLIKHLSSILIIFPTISDLFNFIRYSNDEQDKEKLKRHYNKNNILTQKSEFISTKLSSFRNIFIMDYFGMDPQFLTHLMTIKAKHHNVISFVLNPDATGNLLISFPYGNIVNNIIESGASDDELFIYLQLMHNSFDKETCMYHINFIRNHLKKFQQVQFKVIKNLNDYSEEIIL